MDDAVMMISFTPGDAACHARSDSRSGANWLPLEASVVKRGPSARPPLRPGAPHEDNALARASKPVYCRGPRRRKTLARHHVAREDLAVITACLVRADSYRDSVELMRVAALVEKLPGVRRAALMMA